MRKAVGGLVKAQPVLGIIASDASLRGVMDGFDFITKGVQNHQGSFDQFDKPIVSMSDALANILADKPAFFSWQTLLSNGEKPSGRQLRKFIQVSPVLDFSALEPGEKPTTFVRDAAKQLDLTKATGAEVRITGQVPISDDEFSTVADGFGLNGAITAAVVLLIIYSALKSVKIVAAVFRDRDRRPGDHLRGRLGAGRRAQPDLDRLRRLVRRHRRRLRHPVQRPLQGGAIRLPELRPGLVHGRRQGRTAARPGRHRHHPQVSTPSCRTTYRGVSELGEIAGTGMLIAFTCSVTLLPALLTVIKPAPEREPAGYKFLAPVDDFIHDHRYVIIIGDTGRRAGRYARCCATSTSTSTRSTSTTRSPSRSPPSIDLMKDPETDTQVISVLEPNLAAADATADKLRPLPDVARVTTLTSLVPTDQDQKLAAIAQAKKAVGPILDPSRALDAPSDEDDVESIRKTARSFAETARDVSGQGAQDARRFADLASKLADAPPAVRQRARAVLIPPLKTTVSTIRDSLDASRVTLDTLPPALKALYMTPGGQARVEAAPKGDPNDNDNMIRFAKEIQTVAPTATGQPVSIQEAGRTVKFAFIEAGAIALASIFVILWIVLRRVGDVLLTLVPLLLAGVVTLEITVIIDMPLNFANIIALPLLLGLGVAFKIYFVMAWRAGTTKLLQSSLTRAVFWSALTTATAFGSLWASKHPGTSSMGKLMALSLVCTLAAAILFQPALMGPPRKTELR